MAVDLYQLDRISRILKSKNIPFQSKKMMGGQVILIDEKMLMGLDQDKSTGENRLMVRVGKATHEEALKAEGARPMDFNGKPMKGFVFVYPEGFDLEEQLEYWINAALAYNPIAKKSKK
jgi:TfoX/Sxy family transcriptional regulator of competence genes